MYSTVTASVGTYLMCYDGHGVMIQPLRIPWLLADSGDAPLALFCDRRSEASVDSCSPKTSDGSGWVAPTRVSMTMARTNAVQ